MKKLMIALTLLGLAACTKDVPYQYAFKEKEMAKPNTDGDYLYSASVLEMSRHTNDGRPFQFGDNRRVQLKWTEDSLQVIEKDSDQRYDREINSKVILSIPVEYTDYECAKDAYGECTGKETKKEVNWSEMTKVKFKEHQAVKQGSLEVLPILVDQALGSRCYDEVSSEIVGLDLSDTAINIQVKRNFQQSIKCMDSVENSLSETNISMIVHYSMVKTSSVLSKDFKTIRYPKADENTFGFFSTTKSLRDVDQNLTDNSETTIMNHWNPKRSVIDYYLSDEFNKPEHKVLKETTYLAVQRLNEGLSEAGVQFRIQLHEPDHKNPGDIRNSMIVLVEDPYESAPIGYGPQTEDPSTGEIISARTIMYLSGVQQYVKYNYDDIGRALNKARVESAKTKTEAGQGSENTIAKTIQQQLSSEFKREARTAAMKKSAAAKTVLNSSKPVATTISGSSQFNPIGKDLSNEVKDVRNYRLRVNESYSKKDAASYVKYITEAKNCAYGGEDSDALTAGLSEVRPDLMNRIGAQFGDENGLLKPWSDLSAKEKKEVMDLLIPEVWLPVLLHELGHNMGLRHNFQGSEDKDNFYSAAELKAKNIDHAVPYSSIMEYGNDLRTLPMLGRYDVAALRYAYARKVKVIQADGQVQETSLDGSDAPNAQGKPALTIEDLQQNSDIKLVDFGYCTDENVGPNAGCRRFDEGSSYTDIADYLIQFYKNFYQARSTRYGRNDFSARTDAAYAKRQYQRFIEMRTFMEIYERIRNLAPIYEEGQPAWETQPFLKDLKTATLKVERFMLEVLSTPDLHCVVLDVSTNKLAGIVPLTQISPRDITCQGLELTNKNFKVVGEIGKQLNSKKSPDSKNPYFDQIDVRGFWMDKWAAAKALFGREISPSFDRYFDNAWDIQELKPEISLMLTGLLTNKLLAPQEVRFFDGSPSIKAELKLDMHSSQLVTAPIVESTAKALGISANKNSYFSEILSKIVFEEGAKTTERRAEGLKLQQMVAVRRLLQTDGINGNLDALLSVNLGAMTAYASDSNLVARDLMLDLKVNRALNEIEQNVATKLASVLSQSLPQSANQNTTLTKEDLQKQVPELTDSQASAILDLFTKAPADIADRVDSFSKGQMMSEEELTQILFALPNQ
ncbi:MAG: hypothetical protein COT73_01335 [Bdellovibrio sp. CG10_big_fil_rev_8_21_14_0_10_47_8]|nr:MAG: hypothetical protein COT73_01335 [Bdellovibrio sp. CG10_big_fil_rev_8_21_14_0_10_47_8]